MLSITTEEIFRSPGQIKVLRVLSRAGKPLTGRQVQNLAGLANLAAMQSLKKLTDLGVVSCRRAGRAHQYELKRDHWAVEKLIAPIFENEGKGLDLVRELLAGKLRGQCLAAYLYGSALSAAAVAVGDLDLFVVAADEDDKTALESGPLPELAEEVLRRFGLFLEPNVVSKAGLSRPSAARLAREISRGGRKICGADLEEIVSR